ncbi:hypothetical protein N7474_000551 [Penicillium riverlandense]|uniref:uncharacterized protein n=1 Tax=Penicillium riverlandense TaxID=1903569 RepID=UPI0025486EFC|nr:uncharacterized protein N7474_000551 [Penicillium riverlandense]KAJ5832240.1 hypothetical protein N7474_000551 [Penicillium riverlandense]
MPPFRNFLNRKSQPGETEVIDNHLTPNSQTQQRPAPVNCRRSQEREPTEYKLGVINDSGVYLPPSPPERSSFWRRYPSARSANNHRDLVDENEPFSISRESFDSYRRSFDISARSPVIHPDASRTSLDSRVFRIASPTAQPNNMRKTTPKQEDDFEDVGLNDEAKPKKKGIFARFGDSSGETQQSGGAKPTSTFGFHIPGRKRGQSAGGSELNPMNTPAPTSNPVGGE